MYYLQREEVCGKYIILSSSLYASGFVGQNPRKKKKSNIDLKRKHKLKSEINNE